MLNVDNIATNGHERFELLLPIELRKIYQKMSNLENSAKHYIFLEQCQLSIYMTIVPRIVSAEEIAS